MAENNHYADALEMVIKKSEHFRELIHDGWEHTKKVFPEHSTFEKVKCLHHGLMQLCRESAFEFVLEAMCYSLINDLTDDDHIALKNETFNPTEDK